MPRVGLSPIVSAEPHLALYIMGITPSYGVLLPRKLRFLTVIPLVTQWVTDRLRWVSSMGNRPARNRGSPTTTLRNPCRSGVLHII